MTPIIDTKPKRRLSAKLATGVAISAMLAFGSFAGPASADWDGNHREAYRNWNGGFYQAPPVVYGSQYGSSYYGAPYYYPPPPVIYGPGIGIGLPGVRIGIGR
jgi:hypothetical protein